MTKKTPTTLRAFGSVTREHIDAASLRGMVDAIETCENVANVVCASLWNNRDPEGMKGDETDHKVEETLCEFLLSCYKEPTLAEGDTSPSKDKYLMRWREKLHRDGLNYEMVKEKPSPKAKAEVVGFRIITKAGGSTTKTVEQKYETTFKTLQKLRGQMNEAAGKRYDERAVAAIQRGATEL